MAHDLRNLYAKLELNAISVNKLAETDRVDSQFCILQPVKPSIEILEVGPRDGLQNEDTIVSTKNKLDLISRLVRAGARRLEVTSFVSPRAVPQLADAESVIEGLDVGQDVRLSALILNSRGLDRALSVGINEINFVVLATDSFNQRNQGKPTADSISDWHQIATDAKSEGVFTTLTIGAAFGCPFEGEVVVEKIRSVLGQCLEGDPPDELCLADTIGSGVPSDVARRVEVVKESGFDGSMRCHFHNTRNTGYANAIAAISAGVTVLDSSIGGIGGCPFSPQASGNIATEDLAYILGRSGFETGLELDSLFEVTRWAEKIIGHEASSMVPRAAAFPG